MSLSRKCDRCEVPIDGIHDSVCITRWLERSPSGANSKSQKRLDYDLCDICSKAVTRFIINNKG